MLSYPKTFTFWAFLVALFLAAVVLYAEHGEGIILSVYRTGNVMRAEDWKDKGRLDRAVIEYADYLNVRPADLHIRGLLVSALIERNQFHEARRHAQLALKPAPETERGMALLVAARVRIERAEVDAAGRLLRETLDRFPDSGEAHWGLARVAIARGDFETADLEAHTARRYGGKDSTTEYREAWEDRVPHRTKYLREIDEDETSAKRLLELGAEFVRLADFRRAIDAFTRGASSEGASAVAQYWIAVRAERDGDLREAARLYAAAYESDSTLYLARYARDRLE